MKRLNDEFQAISQYLSELHTLNANHIKQKIDQRNPKRNEIITEINANLAKQIEIIKLGTETLANQIYDRALHLDKEKLEKMFNEVLKASQNSPNQEVQKAYSQLLGFSDETLDLFFKVGYFSYNEENYDIALKIYHFLPILNSNLYPYWFGLGATEQAIAHYPEALKAYLMATKTDPENSPVTYLSCAFCANENKDKAKAIEFLDKAIELAELNDEFKEYKQVALAAKSEIR